jgi:ribose 5-phosphate isomerase A
MSASSQLQKQDAARRSLEYVRDGMTLGLGTGSTASIAVRLIGEAGFRGIRGVATSEATARLAREVGIPLVDLNDIERIDVTIDGADEIGPGLALIKGGGGALLREKLVAMASRKMVVIADASKLVPQLGSFPLPVEVIAFSWRNIQERLQAFSIHPVLRTRGGVPVQTDQGNLLLDCHCGAIPNPGLLAREIKAISGVVDHGLFLDLATVAVVAGADGVRTVDR